MDPKALNQWKFVPEKWTVPAAQNVIMNICSGLFDKYLKVFIMSDNAPDWLVYLIKCWYICRQKKREYGYSKCSESRYFFR